MKPSKKAILLANAFSEILNDWIPDKLFEVNLRNKEKSYIDGGFCATHDFCDPNQAMIDAFKKLYGYEPSTQNQQHLNLIGKAWILAKDNEFKQLSTNTLKYDYWLVIQQNKGLGWEDVQKYEATPAGFAVEMAPARSPLNIKETVLARDFRTYKLNNPGVKFKIINRKTSR